MQKGRRKSNVGWARASTEAPRRKGAEQAGGAELGAGVSRGSWSLKMRAWDALEVAGRGLVP